MSAFEVTLVPPVDAAPLQKSYHVAPVGKYTERDVAPCVVIGATKKADPNIYSVVWLRAFTSVLNSNGSVRMMV